MKIKYSPVHTDTQETVIEYIDENTIIKELGCYFLSLGRIIELETSHKFAINEVWRNSIAHIFAGFILDQVGAGPQGLFPLFISQASLSTSATGVF